MMRALSMPRPKGRSILREVAAGRRRRLLPGTGQGKILAVSGRGFGWPGYVRFAYCVSIESIRGCAPALMRVMEGIKARRRPVTR